MSVYFVRDMGCGSIKIGFTGGPPADRVAKLQTSCPHELQYLGAIEGGQDVEHDLHVLLAAHRVRGEWFRPVPEVLGVVVDRLTVGVDDFCSDRAEEIRAGLRASLREEASLANGLSDEPCIPQLEAHALIADAACALNEGEWQEVLRLAVEIERLAVVQVSLQGVRGA